MRVPVDWLREYVAVPADATGAQIAADLVRVGLEEEGLHTGGVTGPLVVGRVLTREPEPQKNGKTINWCTVDVGDANGTGEPQGIVCGAHNFDVGDLVVVILPGGVLQTPQGPLEVSARKTYGHVSAGMICSERELGIGDDHDGILVLTRRFAGDDETLARLEPGTDAIPLLGLDRETVEINVTPDRGYCFSIRGVAREYSHSTGAEFTDPALDLAARAPAATEGGFPVTLADDAPIRGHDGCDRYVARIVRGIDVTAPTPRWMATRLTEAGMRPISLPVDVTNYVMLGLGQPLHAFDVSTLRDGITVRRARAGERITTLDDVDRALDTEDLLITDSGGERALAIAGVMGGADTEVGPETTDVLIEAAHFDAVSIARSARRHKLPSEASRRFERGVDPQLAAAAAQLAVDLLVKHGGGVADDEVTDVGSPAPMAPVAMDLGFPTRIVGVEYPADEVVSILESIGCEVSRDGEVLTVVPPSWRPDLTTAEDLVEEVARIDGYDRIPSVLPTPPGGAGLTHAQRVRRVVANTLAGQGLSEVWSAPFVAEERYAALGLDVPAELARSVRLANPLSDEQPLMRTRLLATLVDSVRRNVSRGARDVGLFEIGLVVDLKGEQQAAPTEDVGVRPSDEVLAAITAAVPAQPRHVAFALAGERDRAGWWGGGRGADVTDVIELARVLGEALAVRVTTVTDSVAPFHPGRCARVALDDGTVVGHVGELHPKVVAALGLPARTVAGELDLDLLTTAAEGAVQAQTLATFPVAQSDVALVVDEAVTAAEVESALRSGAGESLESVTLFDVYRGDQLDAGKKSLAYRLAFRSADRTLTTDEVSALRDAAVAEAGRRSGAVQR
ncbi:phenylalanyl-tRNA synthetase beta subunit [Knoellia remsis]|uniref:Phenylalanine--tRNA ligase beta subunit n=1 Tax=Knoellia remsis TaxID=407159 RepID=A0A2T0V0T1_9MICO|nr:phenylalanine--tRNA ligase subunit beta [Knoellia remsis]PRY63795.1 phenylalanyl-tRNA synthetase beta subunit [Knoellia remsis]